MCVDVFRRDQVTRRRLCFRLFDWFTVGYRVGVKSVGTGTIAGDPQRSANWMMTRCSFAKCSKWREDLAASGYGSGI